MGGFTFCFVTIIVLGDLQNPTDRCIKINTDELMNGNFQAIKTLCKTVSVPFSYEIVNDFVDLSCGDVVHMISKIQAQPIPSELK